MEIEFTLNGNDICIEADPMERLLDVLRDTLHRKGTKEGCGVGACGACTVIMDGKTINSCITPICQVKGKKIITIEGLCEDELADTIKECFVEEGAVQCGFCTPGMILSAYVLLKTKPHPTIEEIKNGLSGNLCRCTGYIPIINAVKQAVERGEINGID